jgi:hypothetical protein
MLEDDKVGARIATDLWFSFMELEVGWTEEFKFFILLNEVLEAAWNPEDWRRLNLSTNPRYTFLT